MCKKLFISIVTAIIVIISGTKNFKYFKDDNSVEENIVKETCTNENLSTDTVNEEVKENTEVENSIIEKIDDNNSEEDEVQITNKNEENKNNAVIKNDKSNNIIVKNQTIQEKKEQKTTSNAETKNVEKNDTKTKEKVSSQEPQKTQTNNTNEKDKEQKITEEYIYNDTATKKLINDINEIAKKNPDLWGADGKKLYNVKVSKTLLGQNYMFPYNYKLVEGKVLNVFPVTFLVYAIDYKKTGFATETRYYIDIE